MTVNLLELVQNQLTGSLTSKIGDLLGTDAKGTETALAAATPSLLGGLMKQGSTEGGAGALEQTLDKLDGGILDNIGSMFGGGKESGLMDMGGNLVSGLFGGSLGSITDLLGKATGLAGGKAGSLLKMLAPLVFGVLAKQKGILGLGAAGLGKLLMGQGQFLKGMLPAGMGNALGINSLLGGDAAAPKAQASAPAHRSHQEAKASGGSMLSKLVPLALVLGLGFFAYNKWIAKGEVQAGAPSVEASGISSELQDTLGGITSSLGEVTDEASAKAALPKLETAATGLTGISSSLDALPAAAQGPIRSIASKFIPSFEGTMGKIMEMGGAKSVLEPILGKLMGVLKGLAG